MVTGGGPTAGIEQPGQVEQVEVVEEVDQGPGGPEDRQ